jgi:hypothetical protein
MESFSEIISRLLIRHNCVIVPDFGGFVARTTVAEIDETRGLITPPRKAILFNQQLIISDGLLISEYALSNSISFTEAQTKIESIIQLWKSELNQGKTISIAKVGELSLNEQGNLFFEQDRFFNLLLNSFGLGNVQFVPSKLNTQVVEDEVKKDIEIVDEPHRNHKTLIERTEENVDLSIIEHPVLSRKTKKWKIALAAACILPLAFYSFWLPTQTNVLESKVLSFKDFNPFHSSIKSIYHSSSLQKGEAIFTDMTLEEQIRQIDSSANSFSYEFDENFYLTIPLNKKQQSTSGIEQIETSEIVKISDENTDSKDVIKQPNLSTSSTISFNGVKPGMKYVIAGCFSEEMNAKNYIQELTNKGFNAKFLDYNKGLYRIYIDEGNNTDSLQTISKQALSKGYSTWILK